MNILDIKIIQMFLIPNYLIIFYSLLRLFKDGAKFNFVDQ